MKIYALPANEDWICDQLVEDFNVECDDISVNTPREADIIWLISDWRWQSLPLDLLRAKKVVTTVHHIVPSKFDKNAVVEFHARDRITDVYHVYNQRTYDVVTSLTKKNVVLLPYWANGNLWRKTEDKKTLRAKHGLPDECKIIGSFQRDTEGYDLLTPKLEKGPDILADFLISEHTKWKDDPRNNMKPHVLLAGWRRQYVIGRLRAGGVPYTYIERPAQTILNDLYQTLDLYAVTARCEGGPQALIECGLLNVPVVSTPVGIAEQVLPESAIHRDVSSAIACVPNVDHMRLPHGMKPYRDFFLSL